MAPRSPRLHPGIWALLAGAAVAAACAGDEPPVQEEQHHTAGEYVHGNHPLYWNDSDFAAFRAATEDPSWGASPMPVGADDVAQRWLQHWADRIDALVRAKVKADTGEDLVAPKPVMHLLPASSISNAWVTPLAACVPWTVRATGSTTGGGEPPSTSRQTILFNHYQDTIQSLDDVVEAGACIPRDDLAPFADTFLAEWNRGTPLCEAKVADDGAIEVDESCVGAFAEAANAAVYAISPHVQFSSDLVAATTEAGAVFIIGHELAHYYRAHGSPLTRHAYDFWYDQDARTPRRPVPSREADELKELYQEIEAMPRAQAAMIPGATHSPRYRRVVVSPICRYLDDRSREEGFPVECADAVARCGEVSELAWAAVATEEQVASYLALEPALAACGEGEQLGNIGSGTVESLVSSLQKEGYLPGGSPEEVPLPRKFGALLTMLQTTAAEQDAKVAKFAEKLRKGRIGLYTEEQEADDLAVEWVNALGFTTDQAIDGWLAFLEYTDRWGVPSGEMSSAECRDLWESNFKDGRAFVTVWLGDLDSAHHAGCYRVYNIWREQRAHRYTPASAIPRPDFATWDEVLEHAKQLSL